MSEFNNLYKFIKSVYHDPSNLGEDGKLTPIKVADFEKVSDAVDSPEDNTYYGHEKYKDLKSGKRLIEKVIYFEKFENCLNPHVDITQWKELIKDSKSVFEILIDLQHEVREKNPQAASVKITKHSGFVHKLYAFVSDLKKIFKGTENKRERLFSLICHIRYIGRGLASETAIKTVAYQQEELQRLIENEKVAAFNFHTKMTEATGEVLESVFLRKLLGMLPLMINKRRGKVQCNVLVDPIRLETVFAGGLYRLMRDSYSHYKEHVMPYMN